MLHPRLLPLAIRAVRAAKRVLARIESDLASLVEPETVDDLVARCFECQAPGSLYCTKCQVLNTGKVPS